ncbi:hypothetical protein LOK49_LG14G01529 [Camellia lanceoleosa]|uniref:Uncharacterized protein n=1 Tax=Camellia lanceoleosa TaxID=1840588 RepID=A0ACC0FDP7_9ERIC|nr:hypothetical protein LOK49_LG14G01529 [Camellia lanceoleosa]
MASPWVHCHQLLSGFAAINFNVGYCSVSSTDQIDRTSDSLRWISASVHVDDFVRRIEYEAVYLLQGVYRGLCGYCVLSSGFPHGFDFFLFNVWVMMNKETQRLSKIPDEVRVEIGPYFLDSPPVLDKNN